MDPILIVIQIFIVLAILTLSVALFSEKQDSVDRVDEFMGELKDPGFNKRVLWPLWNNVAKVGRSIYPKHILASLDKYCLRAGRPLGIGGEMLAGLKISAGIVLGLPFLFLPGRFRFLTVLAALVGYLLPGLWISSKIKKRQAMAISRIPDAMDLLVMGVEAGLGLDAAFHKMAERIGGSLGEVFNRALAEINLGENRAKALRGIVERLPIDDLEHLINSIIQAEQLGISIGPVLKAQALGMRRRRRLRAEEHARKAPIKILFPMVLFIFPSLFVVILGPAIITLVKELGSR